MRSKNKPAQTAAESRWAGALADLACVVCEAPPPSEVHEPEQGLWFAGMPLCWACHRGPDGWHGTRRRWTLRRMDETKAINKAVGLVARGLFTGLLS
jgi:hypothetical protein